MWMRELGQKRMGVEKNGWGRRLCDGVAPSTVVTAIRFGYKSVGQGRRIIPSSCRKKRRMKRNDNSLVLYNDPVFA
jgi:hypothetical protein